MAGSSTSKTTVPKWLEDAARTNMGRADEIAKVGYTPYFGPDVAALNPTQLAAMNNNNSAASAFGMATADPTAGLPQAHDVAGGGQGDSSAPIYLDALAQLKANNPAQYEAISSMFMNPQTGAAPRTPFNGVQAAPAPAQPVPAAYSGSDGGGNTSSPAHFGSSGGRADRDQQGGPAQTGFMGYKSVADMFDRGGPGKSSGAFSGGGLLSSAGNSVFGRK